MTTSNGRRGILCLLIVAALPLLSYPLSWLPASSTPFRFNLTLPFATIALATILLVGARALWVGDTIVCPRALLGPCLLLAMSWLLSVRFSRQPFYSVGSLTGCAANIAILLLASQFPERRLSTLARTWLATATFIAANGLFRFGSAEFLSTVGNRNFLGAYLAASVLIGVGLWNYRAAFGCALPMAALVLTGSRGAWLALAVVSSIWFVFSTTRGRIWKALVVVIVGAALALFGHAYIVEQWRTDVRPLIWRGTMAMSRIRPILGHGLATFAINYPKFRPPEYFLLAKAANLTDHAHNELLETLAEQGIVGLVATVWLWVAVLRLGLRRLSETNEHGCLRAGLLAATGLFMLHGMVDVDLRYPPNQTLFWFLLGVIASGGPGDQQAQVTLHNEFARRVLAGACIVAAVVVAWCSVVQPIRADFWERRARIEKERGELVAASDAAERALVFQPLRLGTRYFLAGVLAQMSSPEARARAIDEAQRIEEYAPDYADITFNLGQLLAANHRSGEALEYLQRAVQLNPYNADKRFVLALVLGERGDLTGARKQLDEVVRLDPHNERARALLAHYGREAAP
jgi:O-antigen ligase